MRSARPLDSDQERQRADYTPSTGDSLIAPSQDSDQPMNATRLMLLFTLFLAGCAPALPSAPQDVPPEYVAYLSARWTATAGAEATESARATATESVARASATAAYLSTRDALTVRVTELALSAIETSQSVAATDAASIKTQAADMANLRETQAAAITLGKATDEANLRETQAAAIAERVARDQNDALAWGAFWDSLREVAYFATLALAIVVCLVSAGWGFIALRIHQINSMVSVVLRVLAPGQRVEPDFWGGVVIVDPPALAPPDDPDEERKRNAANQHQQDWRAAIKRCVYAGIQMGGEGKPQFGERDLAGDDERNRWIVNSDGTPNSAGYRRINHIVRSMKIWETAGRDTVFGEGMDAESWERVFDTRPLPSELIQGPPPHVRVPLRGSAIAAIRRSSAVPRLPAQAQD